MNYQIQINADGMADRLSVVDAKGNEILRMRNCTEEQLQFFHEIAKVNTNVFRLAPELEKCAVRVMEEIRKCTRQGVYYLHLEVKPHLVPHLRTYLADRVDLLHMEAGKPDLSGKVTVWIRWI